ncbi:MAG: hypothetical protein ACI4LX_12180 [Treponema sp.]
MKIKRIIFAAFFAELLSFCFAQTRPVATDINTIPAENGKIKITWTIPEDSEPKITGFVIYRDTRQISSYEQLNALKPVAKLASDVKMYSDSVSDSREYFYAVISVTEKGNYNIILPSINTTVYGVKTSTDIAADQSPRSTQSTKNSKTQKDTSVKIDDNSEKMRSVPLPALGLVETPKAKNVLGQKAIDTAKSLAKDYVDKKNVITQMHIFEEDLICPQGGDEYLLFKILKNNFVKKDFYKSISELSEFLNVHRSEEVTNRAVFYLGESYYFTQNYQNALFQFLTVKEAYPALSKKWIDSSLDLIELEKD